MTFGTAPRPKSLAMGANDAAKKVQNGSKMAPKYLQNGLKIGLKVQNGSKMVPRLLQDPSELVQQHSKNLCNAAFMPESPPTSKGVGGMA